MIMREFCPYGTLHANVMSNKISMTDDPLVNRHMLTEFHKIFKLVNCFLSQAGICLLNISPHKVLVS